MKNEKDLNVGLIGMGCVGQGVLELLNKNSKLITQNTGLTINLKKVCNHSKKVNTHGIPHTTNFNEIVNDPEIDIVLELIGGTQAAYKIIKSSLKNNKHVITANKALLAEHGKELMQIATEHSVKLLYEASVGGGIPIIEVLQKSLASNDIKNIYGIMNGTSNFILTKMKDENYSFDKALDLAKKLGYAEADPTLDISGGDAAHKALVLASTVYGIHEDMENIIVEGIDILEPIDFTMASDLGYTIKHIGVIGKVNNCIDIRSHAVMIKKDNLLSSVNNELNAIFVEGDYLGPALFYGKGAGSKPTASSVVSDLISLGLSKNFEKKNISSYQLLPQKEISSRYYLNFNVHDKPMVLAGIAKVLGENDISISSALQKERSKETVPVIMLTHITTENKIQKALKEISKLDFVTKKPKLIRILD